MVLNLPASWTSTFPLLAHVWIQAAAIAIVTIIASVLLTFIIKRYVVWLTKKTKTKADDLIIEKNQKRFAYLLITLGFQAALAVTPLLPILQKILGALSIFLGVMIVSSVFSILFTEWGHKLAKKTKTSIDEALIPLVRKSVNVILAIMAFLAILRLFNWDIAPYLTGIGISGLVLGFALQDTLKNIFGGISLIFDKNFAIGDKIKLESGIVGELLEIGLRSTKIRTFNNEVIFVPNGQLANQRIQNFREPSPPTRIVIPFGVAYGSNVDKVKKVVLGVIKKNTYHDKEGRYTDVIFTEMAESSIKFEARFWVHTWKDAFQAKITATEEIYRALVKNKIDIPFPTRTIHIKK